MIDFTEVSEDGETWELFARDFLQTLGFYVESSPDRGPDGGKDLIVTEELRGYLGNYKFRWLVSCKHYAKSNKSVQEKDEINIRERVEAYNADGFIAFYSTVPSSGLNTRIIDLKKAEKIKDYRVFDHKLIENHLIRVGYSELVMRYFPQSYRVIKPLHVLLTDYVPLNCAACKGDLLELLYEDTFSGNIIYVETYDYETQRRLVEDIYWVHKGKCDEKMQRRYPEDRTTWKDIGDLAIPVIYLRWLFTHMNKLRDGSAVFTDKAYEKLNLFNTVMAQKVLREMTEEERERALENLELSQYIF